MPKDLEEMDLSVVLEEYDFSNKKSRFSIVS